MTLIITVMTARAQVETGDASRELLEQVRDPKIALVARRRAARSIFDQGAVATRQELLNLLWDGNEVAEVLEPTDFAGLMRPRPSPLWLRFAASSLEHSSIALRRLGLGLCRGRKEPYLRAAMLDAFSSETDPALIKQYLSELAGWRPSSLAVAAIVARRPVESSALARAFDAALYHHAARRAPNSVFSDLWTGPARDARSGLVESRERHPLRQATGTEIVLPALRVVGPATLFLGYRLENKIAVDEPAATALDGEIVVAKRTLAAARLESGAGTLDLAPGLRVLRGKVPAGFDLGRDFPVLKLSAAIEGRLWLHGLAVLRPDFFERGSPSRSIACRSGSLDMRALVGFEDDPNWRGRIVTTEAEARITFSGLGSKPAFRQLHIEHWTDDPRERPGRSS